MANDRTSLWNWRFFPTPGPCQWFGPLLILSFYGGEMTVSSDSKGPGDEWEIDNLPNRLTLMRIALVPVIGSCLLLSLEKISWAFFSASVQGWVAAVCFTLAGITDFFDGYIARKRGIVTVFGSFLDPIADKFLVVSSLIFLLALGRVHALIVVILVLREMYIISLRLLASERSLSVPVGPLGRWKTGLQMVAIPILMVYEEWPFGLSLPVLGTWLLGLASIFSCYSALEYSLRLMKKIKRKRQLRKKA